jgi:hypothetical protein
VNPELKLAFDRILSEIKKDMWFFGLCGMFVGLFMVWQFRFRVLGIAENPRWASDVFADFMSVNAFCLISFGYLILACISTMLKDLGCSWPKLELAVNHVESRLVQIVSSMVSFMAGLLVVFTIYTGLVLDSSGLWVAFLAILFSVLVIGGFVAAVLVGHRTKPFDSWWAALLILLVTVSSLGWLLIQGHK